MDLPDGIDVHSEFVETRNPHSERIFYVGFTIGSEVDDVYMRDIKTYRSEDALPTVDEMRQMLKEYIDQANGSWRCQDFGPATIDQWSDWQERTADIW